MRLRKEGSNGWAAQRPSRRTCASFCHQPGSRPATNRDLAEAVRRGTFREDLHFRLNLFPIRVPPLRERVEDIPALTEFFIHEFAGRYGRMSAQAPQRVTSRLQGYRRPGNVRGLPNVIERAMIISSGETLEAELPQALVNPRSLLTLAQSEIAHFRDALKRTGGQVKGPRGASAFLGINPSTLYSPMKKLGIASPKSD